MKIIVASENPVKINAVSRGFQKMFAGEQCEVEGVSVPSGVSNQPKNDEETLAGAMRRMENVRHERPDADFCVGIEGGIEENGQEVEAFAWVVVKSKDGRIGKGRAGTFFLPPKMAQLIRQGKELGEAADIVFERANLKHQNGAVGALTGNVIDRTDYYVHPVVLAIIPFKNSELYGK